MKKYIACVLIVMAAFIFHSCETKEKLERSAKRVPVAQVNLATNMAVVTKRSQEQAEAARRRYDEALAEQSKIMARSKRESAKLRLKEEARKLAEENAKLYPDMYPPTPTPTATPAPEATTEPEPEPTP